MPSFSQGPYPRIHNMRAYARGRLQTRFGSSALTTSVLSTPLHSIRRLNDQVVGASQDFTRVVGAGTLLYTGKTTQTQVTGARGSGYSGNPLSLIPYRPDQSPEALMYVMDSSNSAKLTVGGSAQNMGGDPPLNAPTPEFGVPTLDTIDTGNVTTGWSNLGTAGALSSVSRFSTTITAILYDTGTTGWATVQPASLTSGISPRGLLIVNSGGGSSETVEITEVHPAITTTTISRIAYDSGTTGACTIQLVAPNSKLTGLERNALLLVGAGGTQERVRVLSSTAGPGNVISFRCSTVNTQAAGGSVSGLASFRAYFTNNHAAAETLAINVIQSTVTTGVGNIEKSISIDLSVISNQPTSSDDYLHVSISVDNPANINEVRLYLDIDSATNDFTKNSLYAAMRKSDIQAAISKSSTTLAAVTTAIQNRQADAAALESLREDRLERIERFARIPIDISLRDRIELSRLDLRRLPRLNPTISRQASTGASQWSELLIPVGELQRVGNDISRTLANVLKVRVQFDVSASTVCQFGAITLRGGFGPDVGQIGAPIFYRYRGRSSTTGAKSNPSPATRFGLSPRRDSVVVTMTQHPDPQYDKLDVFRFGGSLTAQLPDGTAFWAYVGTTTNPASPSFTDTFLDSDMANAPALEFDNFQPFPDIDITRSGTCNVTGTTINWVSGDTFNSSWAQGSEIVIGNQVYHLYAQPRSTTFLEIAECGGSQAGVPFFLQEPTLLNQKLPVMWGPWNGIFFAAGSPNQPGFVFGTKPFNPDSAPDKLQWEISQPSEPVVGGIIAGPLAFACTTARMFQAVLSADPNRVVEWQEIPGSGGLWSRWGICSGDAIYKIETDGIYATVGGVHQSLTSPQLTLLFPHDGQPGQNVTLGTLTFYAPDFTNTANLRLSWQNSHLIFNYIDLNGTRRKLVYSSIFGIWMVDTLSFGSVYEYQEEGLGVNSVLFAGADGNLYQSTGTTDSGVKIASEIRMPYVGSFPGFVHLRDGYLGLVAAASCNFVVNSDGTDSTMTVGPTTNYQKLYFPILPLKARSYEFALNSTDPFEAYLLDCEIHMQPWGSSSKFAPYNPFGSLVT